MEEMKWGSYPLISQCQSQFPIREEIQEGHLEKPMEILSLRGPTQWKEFHILDI